MYYYGKMGGNNGNVLEMSNCKEFEKVLNTNKPVVVAFSSPTCAACMMYRPEYEAAAEMVDNVVFVWFNLAGCPDIAYQLGIMGTPTTVVFKNGEIKGAWIGAVDYATVVEAINESITE
ncbi:MAG: thioredoxin family protein [Desulfurococcales archaeon]|nr:thioredoxin family protein [Desulfurococcales archaeon]